jgi:hypothetical protein
MMRWIVFLSFTLGGSDSDIDPLVLKCFLTAFALVFAVGVLFLNLSANSAGPHKMWIGKRQDLTRNLLCHSDGSLRSKTKFSLCGAIACFVLGVWTLI